MISHQYSVGFGDTRQTVRDNGFSSANLCSNRFATGSKGLVTVHCKLGTNQLGGKRHAFHVEPEVGVKFPVPVVVVGLFLGVLILVPMVIVGLFVSSVLRVSFSKREGVDEGCNFQHRYTICFNILHSV